jgi:hypothetical protein
MIITQSMNSAKNFKTTSIDIIDNAKQSLKYPNNKSNSKYQYSASRQGYQ